MAPRAGRRNKPASCSRPHAGLEPGSDVRGRILTAASQLLATSGIGALTQPRVSRAAGVSQSHLTYYFPRRTDLMLAVARYALTTTVEQIRSGTQAQTSGRVTRAIEAMQLRLSDQRVTRLMLGVIVASEEDPSIKVSITEFIDSVRQVLREVLAEMGLAADAKTAATVHALAVGLAVLHLARDTAASREEVGDVLRTTLPHIAAPTLGSLMPAPRARRKSS